MAPTRRTILQGGIAAAAVPLLAQAAEPGSLRGINLAGAEFGAVPGRHGREYLYPTHANLDYYRALGFGLVRLPFRWERLQPALNQAFAREETTLLNECVSYATGRGLHVVLDPHNYAKRRIAADGWSTEHLIGSPTVPTAAFEDFWARLAGAFGGDAHVIFGLMNEPVGPEPSDWLAIVNGTIAAIRRTGARNLVLVPGVNWTGAHSWHASGNAVLAGIRDPGGAFAFDVHQYFDADSSGTKPEAVSGSIGSERIQGFQAWARRHGFKALLGEFNGGRDATSARALRDILTELEANRDVWIGWAAWAGGPRWPDDDMFNLEPWADGRLREQTAILAAFAEPRSQAWVAPGAEVDLHFGRGLAFGTTQAATLACRRASPAYAALQDGHVRRHDADGLRRTDRGLLIEEARADLLTPFGTFEGWDAEGTWTLGGEAPDGTRTAGRLAEEPGEGVCLVSREVELEEGTPYTLSVHARLRGRPWLILRGDHPSSAFAAFDLARAELGVVTGLHAQLAGPAGGWNRAALTFVPSGRAGAGRIMAALGGRNGNVAAYARGGAGLDLWGPCLEQGAFATSPPLGRRHQDEIELRGRLRDILDGPAFTLVVETWDLPTAPVACEILSAGATALLRRAPDGAVVTALGTPQRTAAQPLARWRAKRRIALSVRRRPGRVALAVTGAEPVGADTGDIPTFDAFGALRLGMLGSGSLNGTVSRLTAYRTTTDEPLLAALTA